MKDCEIIFKNVTVEFLIYDSYSSSIKGKILKSFSKKKISSVTALNNLSFQIKNGERVALFGPNGSGKTTLLRAINGVFKPKNGTINVKGHLSPLIDLTLSMDEDLSGFENIFLRGYFLELTKKKIEEKLKEIIDFSGLGDRIFSPLKTYSSGMKLRLAFSVVLFFTKDILTLDEWLSVGDDEFKKKSEKILLNRIQNSKILVLGTHSTEIIKKVCNRIIILEKGNIVEDKKI